MRRPNILLVDDEPSIRFGIREYLSGSGFEVAEAATVAQALDTAAKFPADLVLTDFRLPDGDALDLMPKLRARDPGLPIILITGFGTVEMAVKAMQLGADHVYTKPVELPMLVAQIQRLRSSAGQRAAGQNAPAPRTWSLTARPPARLSGQGG
ncbi:MAG: response regulator [Holophagaceae bacterium]|nr:response regulator [Holophagaceae bacterium]